MQNLLALRSIELLETIDVKKRLQSLAMLDAIICPEWEYRYFSFNSFWDANESMASMRDGEGNNYFILFKDSKIVGKVFDKQYTLNKQEREKIVKKIPKTLEYFFDEPAFSIDEMSFIFWKEENTKKWFSLPTSTNLSYLGFLFTAEIYVEWAQKYYEIEIDATVVNEIFQHLPLTQERIRKLNDKLVLSDLEDDIQEIGYPS